MQEMDMTAVSILSAARSLHDISIFGATNV